MSWKKQGGSIEDEEEGCSKQNIPQRCANGCDFFGNRETHNLCSKCYCDYNISIQVQEEEAAAAAADHKRHLSYKEEKIRKKIETLTSPANVSKVPTVRDDDVAARSNDGKVECGCCRKKVGMFKRYMCRCGNVYCLKHSYPEDHGCKFDFKAAGRHLLAMANPVVKADKLDRIN